MTSDRNDQAGYTSESLKMLESEEGQLNAVFACFGSAAQHAQFFEESLAKFLLVYNRIAGEALSLQDFETLEAKLQRKTMGWLLKELSRHVTIDNESIAEHLDRALEARNFLMHQFFLSRRRAFESKDGRMTLLAELVAMGEGLDQARIFVNGMRIAMCETLGSEDEPVT